MPMFDPLIVMITNHMYARPRHHAYAYAYHYPHAFAQTNQCQFLIL